MAKTKKMVAEPKQEAAVRKWMAGSSFPVSSPGKLNVASRAFEKVWNELYPNDYDFTQAKLREVHALCLKRGLYKAEKRETKSDWPMMITSMTPQEIRRVLASGLK